MANFKVGDKGRDIAINAKFNMSANTDLEMLFTKPDQTTLTVTKSGGVAAPSSNLTIAVDDVDQTFLANEYFLYAWKTGDLDQAGTWVGRGIYIEGTTKEFCGDQVKFEVLTC